MSRTDRASTEVHTYSNIENIRFVLSQLKRDLYSLIADFNVDEHLFAKIGSGICL